MSEKVYFAVGSGRLKVGTTIKEVTDRITAINSHLAEPLKILCYIDGGLPLERAIQKHLKPWRLKGEWFRDCDDVREIIDRLKADGPSAIGYEGEMFYLRKNENSRTSPGNPRSFGALATLMWPNDAGAQLMAFTGHNEREVAAWIDGSRDAPRLIRYAFATVVTRYISADRPENFVEDSSQGILR